jgi:hypothetical protein
VKLRRCVWAKPAADGSAVLNGHIPAQAQRWGEASTVGLAIGLRAHAGAVSWRRLRAEVLGSPDPARAGPGTLRGLAADGRLPTREPITHSANLAHLSAGPLEALRERWLWLGGGDDEPGTQLIDRPDAVGGWRFAATEHRDAVDVPEATR